MKLKTFKIGGVHPPENKLSAGGEIEMLPLPDQVSIPLSQHLGVPANPVVKKGDQVKILSVSGLDLIIEPLKEDSGHDHS